MTSRILLALLLTLAAIGIGRPAEAPWPSSLRLLAPDSDLTVVSSDAEGTVLESAPVQPPSGWDELVVSWNADTNVTLTVSARAEWPEGPATAWYPFGVWSAWGARSSAKAVRDAEGFLDTDVLSLTRPARAARVRVTVLGDRSGLRRIALAFCNRQLPTVERPALRSAWGRISPVPVRSQAEYPEGISQWCSPTSLSMLLEHWSIGLGRADLNHTVPETAAAVHDPGWGGTGNWPFNTAFAGLHRGMGACVSRFNDLTDLERWVGDGLPVAASVSYALLKGKANPEKGDGHLVVVRGFTAEGDVAINDPGVRRSRVPRTVKRSDFSRAWNRSRRTVYLVWPENHRTPAGECFP